MYRSWFAFLVFISSFSQIFSLNNKKFKSYRVMRAAILFILIIYHIITTKNKNSTNAQVKEGQHPFVAAFAFQETDFRVILPVCGAAIIDKRHVVTASHCLEVKKEDRRGRFMIMVGSIYSLVNKGIWYQIKSYYTTEKQKILGAPVDDIALVRIWGSFEFNNYVQPISISYSTEIPVGEKATVFGWGQYMQKPKTDTSSQLLAVEMEIVDGQKCFELWDTYDNEYNLCAEPPIRTGTCEGDSGGPLVINNILYGLLSYGHVECGNGAPEVYVNVGVFASWLDKKMGEP